MNGTTVHRAKTEASLVHTHMDETGYGLNVYCVMCTYRDVWILRDVYIYRDIEEIGTVLSFLLASVLFVGSIE